MCILLSSSSAVNIDHNGYIDDGSKRTKTLQHHSTSTQLFVGTFVSIQVVGGATAPP